MTSPTRPGEAFEHGAPFRRPDYAQAATRFAEAIEYMTAFSRAELALLDRARAEIAAGRLTQEQFERSPFAAPLAPEHITIPLPKWVARPSGLLVAEDGTSMPAEKHLRIRTSITSFSLVFAATEALHRARPFTFESAEQVRALYDAPFPHDFEMSDLRLPFDEMFFDLRSRLDARVMLRLWDEDRRRSVTVNPVAMLLTLYPPPAGIYEGSGTIRLDPAEHIWRFSPPSAVPLDKPVAASMHSVLVTSLFIDRRDGEAAGIAGQEFAPHTSLVHAVDIFLHWEGHHRFREAMDRWADDARVRGIWTEEESESDRRWWEFVIKVILFQTSPAVIEERAPTTPYLRRVAADAKREDDPAVRVLVVKGRKVRYETPGREAGVGVGYSHRWDVSGHFKHFRRGPMAGRIIWCPPFVKGPKGTPYRPRLTVLAKPKEEGEQGADAGT